MARNQKSRNSKFKAIDFFCGGGGMTCGLRQAGISDAECLGALKEFLERNLNEE
jgi:hypothetical protein